MDMFDGNPLNVSGVILESGGARALGAPDPYITGTQCRPVVFDRILTLVPFVPYRTQNIPYFMANNVPDIFFRT